MKSAKAFEGGVFWRVSRPMAETQKGQFDYEEAPQRAQRSQDVAGDGGGPGPHLDHPRESPVHLRREAQPGESHKGSGRQRSWRRQLCRATFWLQARCRAAAGGVVKLTMLLLVVCSISLRSLSEDQAVPFNLHRGYVIVVKCSVGRLSDLTAIVDTGVTETVIDVSLVKRLSLETLSDRATFLIQEAPVSAVSIPSLQLGPLRTGSLPGIATDLSFLTQPLGIRPDVLIGMDVLHRASFLIDYRAQRLFFGATSPLAHTAHLIHNERFALVQAVVIGKWLLLQVDTGYPSLLLYGKRAGMVLNSVDLENRVQSLSHTLIAAGLRPSDVRIGNWRAWRREVSVVNAAPDSAGFDGLVGPRILGARRIAFDFENNRISWD